MAIAVNVDKVEECGNSYLFWGTMTWDSSYPTNGEAFAITAPVKIETIDYVQSNGGGYVGEWVKSTQKLKAMYGDNNNAADGPLIEVPNATDLSAISMPFFGAGQ